MYIEYLTILVYMIFMVAMGYALRKLNKNISDYFRSGCQGTWWLVGASTFLSGISAYTFTAAGVAFQSGWSALIVYLANALGFFVSFLFIAPWFRQLRAITAPDVVEMRFGKITQQFYAWFSVFEYTLIAGLPLYALAVFCAAVFGLNIYLVIITLGGIVLIYSTTGGRWAVMSSDFLQSLILFSVSLLLGILTYIKVGGFSGFSELVQQHHLQHDFKFLAQPGDFPGNSYTWVWAAVIFVNAVIVQNTLFSAPKYFSVKDGKDARKAALLSCIMMLVGTAFWFLPPMAARLLYEGQVNAVEITKPAEAAYAIISMNILPNGLMGLVIVAMFAATMSSLDTGYNANAAIVVKNIYPAIFKKPLSEKKQLLLGQMTTVVMGICVIITAMVFGANKQDGIFEIMLSLIALLGLPLAIPMLLCLFIRKVPPWSALFTIIITFIPSTIGFFSKTLFGEAWSFQQKYVITITVGILAFILTMLFWKNSHESYKRRAGEFFELMHTPVDFEKEVGKSVDAKQFMTIGSFIIPFGLFICLLLFLPNPAWGRLCILFVAVFILVIGAVLIYFGRRIKKQEESGEKTI